MSELVKFIYNFHMMGYSAYKEKIVMEQKQKRIHFIGCKGVSMSSLMEIASEKGSMVSGSDALLGGHCDSNINKDLDLVVYSAAVGVDNIELKKAKELGIKVMGRGEFLGQVMGDFDTSIAIGGAHGKTSTTAMMAEVLKELNPKVHIGVDGDFRTKNSLASSCHSERSEESSLRPKKEKQDNISFTTPVCSVPPVSIFITEACEYKRSFLKLSPNIAVVLNMDLDHTDCYQSLDDAKNTFYEFIGRAKEVAIVGEDFENKNLLSLQAKQARIIKVGLKNHCDIRAGLLKHDKNGCYDYCLFIHNKFKARIKLKVKGKHNVMNSLFTIAVALELGLSLEQIKKGLKRFSGIGRRLERLGEIGNTAIFSDYAHHPKEIDCTITSMRECGYENLLICFEPHTYTRTQSFYKEFATSLSKAEKIVLLPIFAARENKISGVSSNLIFEHMKELGYDRAECIDDYMGVCEYVKEWLVNNDEEKSSAAVFMGAGTIDKLAREFVDKLRT